MAERLHPGVYIEEVSSGVRPIEGVSTSTTAFVGEAQRGQPHRATLVTSTAEYIAAFGGHQDGDRGYVAAAAHGFFSAGGRRAYIVRVLPSSAAVASAVVPTSQAPGDATGRPTALSVSAKGAGIWGNELRVAIVASARYAGEAFTLRVLRVENGLTRTLEEFPDVRLDPRHDDSVVRVVNESSQYVTVTSVFPAAGSSAGDGTFTALPASRPQLVGRFPGSNSTAYRFDLEVRQGETVLVTRRVDLPATAAAAVRTVAELRALLGDDFTASDPVEGAVSLGLAAGVAAEAAPETLSFLLRDVLDPTHRAPFSRDFGFPARASGFSVNDPRDPAALPAADTVAPLAGGTDGPAGARPENADFFGNANTRTGLHALDSVTVNLVAIPGRSQEAAFLSAVVEWCDQHAAFALIDGPGAPDDDYSVHPLDARNFVDAAPARSRNSAMFYPWIRTPDPLGVGRNPTRYVPPSGHVAGVFARTDITRGVWKAPAGLEATLPGVLGLQFEVSDAQQDLLNPASLNCIRQFPGSGIVVWGARTLANEAEWRYTPVRRTALFLMESIRIGMQWAVFEPNDSALWERLRLNIYNFMLRLFQEGAFQGATPTDAFLVRCDATTNPQANIDAGIVTAQVYFAPLKPAEFVVIQISQKTLAG